MKQLTGLLALLALWGSANAHTLDGDAGFVTQLTHQLIGGHHLPLLLLIVVAAIFLARRILRRDQS